MKLEGLGTRLSLLSIVILQGKKVTYRFCNGLMFVISLETHSCVAEYHYAASLKVVVAVNIYEKWKLIV